MGKRAGGKGAEKGLRAKTKQRKVGPAGNRGRLEALSEPGGPDPTSGSDDPAGGLAVDGAVSAVAPASVLASVPEVWLASVLVPRESFARLVAQAAELPDALRALADAQARAAAAEAELRAVRVTSALLERQLELARGEPSSQGARAGKGLRQWLGRLLGTARGGSDGAQRTADGGAGGADQLLGGG